MKVQRVPIDSLTPYPGNPRRGDVDAIAQSITVNGVYKPIVVQKASSTILAGNHTWEAATRLGMETIDVVWADVDDAAAKRIVLADNRTSDLGLHHLEDLGDLLSSLDDLTGTGYDATYLDGLLKQLHPDFDDDDSSLLDDVDDAAMPTLHIKVTTAQLTKFRTVPGDDDDTRFAYLLDRCADE